MRIKDMATLWENALLIGVVSESCLGKDHLPDTEGLAPNGDREIGLDDFVIFISETSLPRYNQRSFPSINVRRNAGVARQDRELKILICGWRIEWDNPERFAFRLNATARELPTGSEIIFLCMKRVHSGDWQDQKGNLCQTSNHPSQRFGSWSSATSPASGSSFSELMEEVCHLEPQKFSGGDKTSTWLYKNTVKIRHEHGDAAVYENLENVMKERIDKVMVLSTMSHKQMSGFSRDTRLMTVMMGLRQMQRELGQDLGKIHVIGENAMDATSMLCMAPDNGGIPDFVNVHAIYASALAQSLAYPAMQTQISHLLTPEAGSPRLKLEESSTLIPAGDWLFGSILQAVKKERPGDILIGMRKRSGQSLIAPALSQKVNCQQGDMLILMLRKTSHKHDLDGDGCISQNPITHADSTTSAEPQATLFGCDKAARADALQAAQKKTTKPHSLCAVIPKPASVSDAPGASCPQAKFDPQSNLLSLEISDDPILE
eukprot:TRINITY_DN94493_c0_g1_i1.p1 TRINITY_DN94493_c0_g1~~TRINITY_DN94493_c0_g1_i1.p1  ORF type:complete len:489 (-),score=66.16 TRINITY_DN94493_c0_g1_i1:321-1787(-)